MRQRRGRGPGARLVAAALGTQIDRLLGEPPEHGHPLRAFGALMARMEEAVYRDARPAGVLYAASGAAAGTLAGGALRSTTLGTYLACAGHALARAAVQVDAALARGDLPAAREAARSLVGRDVASLGEAGLARAAVESVAENTVDAVIAPFCFAAATGAPGALGYRAVNTLDALVGYKTARYERFGWASARLDDIANYLPARLTALLVALVRPRQAADVVRIVRRDAGGHASPNAGVAEAAFAGALGLRLGGTNTYDGRAVTTPQMGDGRAPERRDIDRAVRLSRDAAGAAVALGLTIGTAIELRSRSRTRTWAGQG